MCVCVCVCVCACQALLQFEEQQGAVVNRMLMSRQQIDRFPTKTFSPAPNAAAAQ